MIFVGRSVMRRRDFITLLGGVAAAWPLAARAQQGTRMRRIGVFMNLPADDPESPTRIAAFLQGLQELGWTEGNNVRFDYRWGAGDIDLYRRYAEELIALAPDIILAAGGPIVRMLQQLAPTVPIVFVQAIDPVGGGGIASLRRPGSNATGFASIEYRIGEKRLELLKQMVPSMTRVAVIRDPTTPAGVGQFTAIQAVAPVLGVELSPVDVRDAGARERAIAAFAHEAKGGLIVTTSTLATIHREPIITLAARHRLPAIYPHPMFVTGGGLMSYGTVISDQYRRAASYVDRILKGEKAADLPVQAPTRYELAINRTTARSLGIVVPRILIAGADEVIE
jgi:putative ABC transport system substrate-binding protein